MPKPATMIRQSVEQRLRAVLTIPPFLVAEDFSITTDRDGRSTVLRVVYVSGNGEIITAKIPPTKTSRERDESEFVIECQLNPGEITSDERLSVWGIDTLLETVAGWAARIAEDLRQVPAFRAIREQAARIEDLESKLAEYPDEIPTPDQISQLEEMIASVEQALRERIEQVDGDLKAKQARLDNLAAEFQVLKDRVESTKVRAIFHALAVRFYNAAADPKFGALLDNGGKIVSLLTNGLTSSGDHK
jgi:hypothetical protein